jgi:homoserine O-acetyltransferase/O-succinyltransferase
MIGHITYLSDASMQKKFGRVEQDEASTDRSLDRSPNYQVESYLNHQGDTFIKRFDANSDLYVTNLK